MNIKTPFSALINLPFECLIQNTSHTEFPEEWWDGFVQFVVSSFASVEQTGYKIDRMLFRFSHCDVEMIRNSNTVFAIISPS